MNLKGGDSIGEEIEKTLQMGETLRTIRLSYCRRRVGQCRAF